MTTRIKKTHKEKHTHVEDTVVATTIETEYGYPHPLGATINETGINFSVFADRATSVELLLFDEHDDPDPIFTIKLDPQKNKTFHFWHVLVKGVQPGIHYAYRVDGYQDVHGKGDSYNPNKVLIDPYARGNTDALWDRGKACNGEDNVTTSMRSVVIDTSHYDWEGDRPLNRLMKDTIIYEMHVKGFTRSSSSNSQYAGTFSGVIEKIPYLQELGVTAVELLPVFDFDQKEVKQISPDGTPLTNYWGYDPISFFAPENTYCVSAEAGGHTREFRDMVKAFHKAGIEVILDVVFNHTSEGNENGPTINFKGFANSCYYMLSAQDRRYHMNFSGCGNTLNGNHPITEKMIIDSLRFWVNEMHVDGFRFDEAAILSRDENGIPMTYPPVIWNIELSEVLADTKVIAEAWDAAGLYQIGYFPGYRWGEWNGIFRDAVRHFIKGDQGYVDGKTIVGRIADVIAGSASIFEFSGELPINSINFITAHDGFTLNDLVSYNGKHNEVNGENNNDGINDNLSWNCGAEGETGDPEILALRKRQIKNFITLLMISQGVPMFVYGDEVQRTQHGNNNAYCQDNELSWFDWNLVDKNQDMFRFFKWIIAFRKQHSLLRRNNFFEGKVNQRGLADISWHGCSLNHPGWQDPESRVLAVTMGSIAEESSEDDADIHVMFNMDWEDLEFDVPLLTDRSWYRVVDTAQPSPNDILEPGQEVAFTGNSYRVGNRSVVVLISR
ncbi:glycogen debranching protein GlgX [Dictyobacter arantiisoli]|uniref:Glycogen debranching enzyme n=1 Tax=Dictyobacter arantiisoli TaxID=2014874 RepID=A0A5A5T9A5_9CHLR|nr:glycogen debranching protein GlgX [Dictyobacter arantiisoli]GCF07968.1 glycogen debranching enzyme [Dictyobacter arantiisoli]